MPSTRQSDTPLPDVIPESSGHTRWVRISHWIVAASVLTLAFSGFVVLMAHPRLYWGNVGNDLTPALFELPISRNFRHGGWTAATAFFSGAESAVTANRTYDIFNQNGWARSLHFLVAWFLLGSWAVYVLRAIFSGHAWRQLLPRVHELSPRVLWQDFVEHLRLRIQPARGGPPYGVLQKFSYALVVFAALPLMVLTGLTMSPAIAAALPFLLDLFGGFQSARTIHFFTFTVLVLFVIAHLLMVFLSGFKRQISAMTFGGSHE